MDEAKATKSNCIMTFCPKCQAHLNCGMYGELPAGMDMQMEMKDLVTVLAEVIINSNGGQ